MGSRRYGQYCDRAATCDVMFAAGREATTRDRMSLFVRPAVWRLRPVRPDVVDSVSARRTLAMTAYTATFAVVFGGVGFGLIYAFRRGAQLAQARPVARGQPGPAVALARGLGRRAHPRLDRQQRARALRMRGALVSPPVHRWFTRYRRSWPSITTSYCLSCFFRSRVSRCSGRQRARRRDGASYAGRPSMTVPGQVGGTLAGKITLPAELRPTGSFTLGLRCVNRVTSNNSGSTSASTWEHVLWNDEQTASSDGAKVPVAFYIAPTHAAS